MTPAPLGRGMEDLIARYGAIVIGLTIGTAAKYGLLLSDGKRPTLGNLLIDALLLGMLGSLAIAVSDWLHLTGNAKVLCGALVAVSSDRLIRLVRDRFLKAADGQMSRLIPSGDREAILSVPAGKGEPDAIGVQVPPTSPAERVGASLRRNFGRSGDRRGVPEDQIELLRKLDE